ncbi:CdaR family transcriptional regulator [Streptomyces sp. TP-A0356]|uniref:PucR family transcriptional regulator n=1 Tax=Streptomyces sp. TP-A0356 TaxID=1359208 RepID=UPI0006E3F779|nr:helix-turn-helix domain-containing protein [Streptomyces sp. TP-A0356]
MGTIEGQGPARSTADPYGLLAMSRAMFTCRDETDILRLALSRVGTLGTCSAEAGYLVRREELVRCPADWPGGTADLDRHVGELIERDGPVPCPGRGWGWAFGLRGLGGLHGYLVVASGVRPDEEEHFLLTVLVQQTSAALSNAATHRRQREDAVARRRPAGGEQLRAALSDLEHQRGVHEALARVAAAGGGEDAIVRTLHDLTGLSALAEDRFGNLRSWAGPGRPDTYPAPDAARHAEMLQEMARELGPVRVGGRLLALARPHGEVLGVLALVDPEGRADERTVFALDHATRALALELAHQHTLAETELRLRRELVDDLLDGTDETSAYARADAVGHDLHRPHHVIVVEWPDVPVSDSFLRAVDRAVSAIGMRALATRRGSQVVLLAQGQPHDAELYQALSREAGSRTGAIGVSARCDTPHDIPRRHQEALRALEVRRHSRERYGTAFFDDLGLYRILGPGNSYHELEEFVREWLGGLIDYDSRYRTALVETLARYFDCGGNYDQTAGALAIHRSTLRYRLQRIREISGRDLSNVDSRLNLHVATRLWSVMLGHTG